MQRLMLLEELGFILRGNAIKMKGVAMIRVKHRGNFKNTERFLSKAKNADFLKSLEKYGRLGVSALSSATPVDSGKTASLWDFTVRYSGGGVSIEWTNSNINDGVPIAVIIQMGHGTRNGGYVQGRDYINPAMRPIFDKISNEVWKEVTSL